MGRILGPKDVEAAVKGGSVFAAGGGGWADHGRMLGTAAVNAGKPELVSMDEVPDDAWIATAAAIGAPAGTTEWEMRGVDYVKAVQLVQEALGAPIYGLMIGQNGKSSTLNGWLPSAILGTKVVDAVGDIRAHPTGDMGSIGLAKSPQQMIQSAVGGNRSKNSYIELVIRGATAKISPVLRTASDMSGGFIASCRNPLPASYVKKNAALGGISIALGLGEAIIDAEPKGGSAVIDAIVKQTRGAIIGQGKVRRKAVVYTNEAFDVGTITIGDGAKAVTLHVMNEYMAVDSADGERLSGFPDVITTLNPQGEPVSVGELREGDELLVLRIPKSVIPLSSSVTDPSVYPVVEKALGINLTDYALR
ncbi:DUF917 family protein [Bradyrhizobium sp. U87765 SZCCT0131]|uniref:DUF917 domain-containing protein n=1 Tax=unclassified Bradyrhizobium TaxID=2631580 RepID=UPI001BA71152|nr:MULTISPECIES: DUF917 family protein [unclassified Bradyrhizobium]MBR1221633.1 DUF917 family protein [Bradyrhizobium sp. U87765 SZCCT0131]MBR1264444.1 DUF917 family protein [Bradyrhizobium sp. U87765 SZCCT0134]MBR1304649.1 DUF917 family protein [Bradyrhizobium sp. U87765 SZCCT0110]MBR1322494.1 DUF917 family protein [Bradyrhizobium sp. U87765 SZCCT0109]MBR1346578.1 DUF917 family protein [Bradyrhizobium sp. U87765 SZCCT0048]